MGRYFFIIFIVVSVIYNFFGFYKNYDFSLFKKPFRNTEPMYEDTLYLFKQEFKFPEIKKVGIYTTDESLKEVIWYDIQDTIMPVLVEDSLNNELIFCVSYYQLCKEFSKNQNAEFYRTYPNNVYLLRRNME